MSAFLQKASLEEIRNAAARICRDYLTGRWRVVKPEQLIVKRISGGLSNFLYYVSLPDSVEDYDNNEEVASVSSATIELTNQIVSTSPSDVTTTGSGTGMAAFDKNSNVSHATKRHQPQTTTSLCQSNLSSSSLSPQQQLRQQQQQHIYSAATTNRLGVDIGSGGGVVDLAHDLATKPHKRQRIDSDSCDSGSSKRLESLKKEPREVLLRIYGQTHGDDALESMITESVVFALLSERNFGPKLHGIFPGGRIEQYIPARSLTTLELSDHRLSMKIAEKMGEIHSLNIPMSKEPDWIWNCMDRWLRSLDSLCNVAIENKPNAAVLGKQRELMRTIDYVQEMKWLKSVIEQGNYSVCFCHNDLQEGNILLRQPTPTSPRASISSLRSNFDETLGDSLDGNGNLGVEHNNHEHNAAVAEVDLLDSADDSALDASFTSDNDPDLIIIDFEYCAYNYRGFDLANHFAEWSFDYTNPEYPYFYQNKEQQATMQQRRDFIVTYLKKYHDDEDYEPTTEELNTLDEEVKLFSMFSHLFWSLWSVVNVTSSIEFGYWDYAGARILEYQQLKEAYLAEHSNTNSKQ